MVTSARDKNEILQRLRDVQAAILARGVTKLGLFGSFARSIEILGEAAK